MIKNIILGFLLSIAFIGCSSKATENVNVTPQLVVGKSLSTITLNDQFEKAHTIAPQTSKIIFAFSKDAAHTCNDYFKMQTPTYLSEHNTAFITDVSAAPSLIRNIFIMPGLKELKHTVLLIEDKKMAAPFKKGLDINKVTVVYLNGNTIKEIKTLTTDAELKKLIEE